VQTVNGVVYPDDRPIIGAGDDTTPGPAFREFRILRADTGELRWLARRGENTRDEVGSGFRFIGAIYDVTDAKRAEAELRELNDTLEQRVEERTQERDRVWSLSRDLIGVWGEDGLYRAVNPAWARLLGYSEAEVIGTRFDSFFHPDDAAAAARDLAALDAASVRNFDVRMRAKDGAYRWVNWTAMNEGGAHYGVGRDVTDRKALEDQLRQSQKMEAVGQLTGGLAHDFNNMLTGIMGGLDVTRRRIADGRIDDIDRFLDAAMASAERAAALTHRLLAFSRRQSLDSESIDVGELVGSMGDLLTRTLGEQTRIEIEVAQDLWRARGDANQLENAVLNLALNARDAMPDGGRVVISAANSRVGPQEAKRNEDLSPGDYVEIRVTDTGAGMAPHVIAKAFDPFFTTKPIGQGTGLGLSMIYGFAKQSGGHVFIDSVVGKGTSVTLRLPRFEGEVEADRDAQATRSHTPRGSGETVLVVEDDEAVRQLVVEVLRELGYEAFEAADGEAALAAVQSARRLDLLITDVGLPGLNGRQLAEIARERHPDLGVLFMTGYTPQAADRPEFLGEGMEMVAKPFAMDALAVKIRAMIEGRSSDGAG
jgi:PAS domain S-box-containing protein